MTVPLMRVLEPEVMDSAQEAADYDSMDHAEVNCVFVHDFLTHWKGDGPVLDVGTGTAQIPIELCRRRPHAIVTAIDLAEHMLAVARTNVERAGFRERIRLQLCDAKDLPFPATSFGAIISNSIVHHIPEPGFVFAEMVRVTKPGGLFFIRDLVRPSSDAELRRLVSMYTRDANPHQRQMFADSLHAALTLDEIRHLVTGCSFDPNDVQQTTDRHWTWCAIKRTN